MRIALVTTTIQKPHVLRLYAAEEHSVGVGFFVAGDLKTPDLADWEFIYIAPEKQAVWRTGLLLPWNTITRRNIAILEALKWGAEVIVTIDDDNFPLDLDYFAHIELKMQKPFSGLQATSDTGWFDVGQLVFPAASHRGFPANKVGLAAFSSVVRCDIGVCAGVVLGDPDISAVTRIATHPIVHQVSEVLRAGIAVDPSCWTVFNTQNTAVRREFAPALLCCPQFGRYDDIFASLVCQRMMRERGYRVHFGQPFVWQQRNPHDLIKDLKAEVFGMEHVVHLATALEYMAGFTKGQHPVRAMYEVIQHLDWCPDGVLDLANAWIDDVEGIL